MKQILKPALVTDSTVMGASSGSDRSEITDLQGLVKISERRMSFGNGNKVTAVGTAAVNMTKLACPKCSKAVYKAEEITMAGLSWHKACFTCGGSKEDDGCQKKLTQNDFHIYRGNPFCKSCIVKQPLLDKKRSDLGLSRSESGTSASADEDITIGAAANASTGEMLAATQAPASSTLPGAKEGATEDTKKAGASAEITASPVEAVVAVPTASGPAMATVLSVNGKESERSKLPAVEGSGAEEKDEDADGAMTTYQDEDGVPCTKDGHPLPSQGSDVMMDPAMELLGSSVSLSLDEPARICSRVFFVSHLLLLDSTYQHLHPV